MSQQMGQMCGEGSHQYCQVVHHGQSSLHFNEPSEDNGILFTCACGCHFPPMERGMVPVRPIASQLPA